MVDEAQRQRTTFPDAREQFIADQGYQRTVVDPIVRKQQNLVKSYEGTGITPQTFPDWVTENPNAFEMMNEWSMPGGGSWMGSPMWMNIGSFSERDLNPDWVEQFPEEVPSALDELNATEDFDWDADRAFSKYQVMANEALERKNIEDAYNNLRMYGKNPMFFETRVTPSSLIEGFKKHDMYNPSMDLMSLPYDADMTPSFTYEDVERAMNMPRIEVNRGGLMSLV